MRIASAILAVGLTGATMAGAWTEPARGSATRSALMDALRPHAEWLLGAPVEFYVHEMRVQGGIAFASVYPQRPGGAEINLRHTPAFGRGEISPDDMEGVGMQALYMLSGQTWVAVHWAIGATDVWYAYEPICAQYRAVVPEACQGM
jgi:hypothetical protein